MGINVGEGVLGLSVLGEDTGGDVVDLADEAEHGVLRQVLEGELALRHVTGVGLAEDGMTVTGNDAASVEGRPEVVLDVGIGKIVTDNLLHLGEPVEDLLVGETVEGTSETVETSGQREHGGGEGRANQVGGVGRDVTTLVIGVDGEVESHELNEVLLVGETELVGQVVGVILVGLDGSNLSILENVAVNARGNGGELRNEVHGVLEGKAPVILLGETLGVGLSELRLVLQSGDGKGELGHGVEGVGAAVDELLNELGDLGAGSPVGGETLNLLSSGDLTGQQEPEETWRMSVRRFSNI